MKNINDELIFRNKSEIIKKYKLFAGSRDGGSSNIYWYNEKELLKLMHKPFSESEKELLMELKKYNPMLFSIPKQDVYINDSFYGYIMNYFYGEYLQMLSDNYLIKDILNAFSSSLESELKKFADDRICLYDLKVLNILFDKEINIFRFIDVDGYKIEKNFPKDQIYQFNASHIFSVVFIEGLLKFKLGSIETRNFGYNHIKNGYSLQETAHKLIETLEDINDSEIKTVKDLTLCRTLKK